MTPAPFPEILHCKRPFQVNRFFDFHSIFVFGYYFVFNYLRLARNLDAKLSKLNKKCFYLRPTGFFFRTKQKEKRFMCFLFCIINEQQYPTIHPLTSRKTSSIDSNRQSIKTKGEKNYKYRTIR
jgi:hypothetical protein